jgi:hypothetical protein
MPSSLIAIVLCMFTQAASAQCTATTTTPAQDTHPAAATARPVGTSTASQATARPAPQLIKTAAAGTRDDAPPVMRDTATARAGAGTDRDHPRRGGTAMLLAALALMSGIALRRYGAPPQ